MNFTLTVSQKKNGTFDHLVIDGSGNVVGTRNSKKHYEFATVARRTISKELRMAQGSVDYWNRDTKPWDGREAEIARTVARRDEFSKLAAAGHVYPAFVLSFNSKPTPLSASQQEVWDFVAVVAEGQS